MSGCDVDGNLDVRRPGGGIDARLLQNPSSQRQHQARRFRKREELIGSEKSSRRMMPAHECLYAANAARADIDHRLIVQFEFVVRYRLAQLAFHRLLYVGGRGQFGLKYPEVVAPAGLHGIKRQVRLLQQRLGIGAVLGREDNSDAGPDADPVAIEVERFFDKPDDPERQRDGARAGADVDDAAARWRLRSGSSRFPG